jgi:hypothetical protein
MMKVVFCLFGLQSQKFQGGHLLPEVSFSSKYPGVEYFARV